ncbi:hypothetical protein FQA47_009772 [Oryzias melastigma]|uniref:Uncharacterized protein n=1 Tax=Oryzias melastigma TaxID=30732 RepID=A0A834CDH8_ORYME|nr:hypothetical protein FQA47_009772 [Oryzias melastigma]
MRAGPRLNACPLALQQPPDSKVMHEASEQRCCGLLGPISQYARIVLLGSLLHYLNIFGANIQSVMVCALSWHCQYTALLYVTEALSATRFFLPTFIPRLPSSLSSLPPLSNGTMLHKHIFPSFPNPFLWRTDPHLNRTGRLRARRSPCSSAQPDLFLLDLPDIHGYPMENRWLVEVQASV